MKRKIFLTFITVFLSISSAWALQIDVTVDFGNATINDDISKAIETELEGQLDKYGDMPKLAKGFANANTYGAHAANARGYQGYDLFNISVGTMASLQAPDSDFKFYNNMQDYVEDGDVYIGVGWNPVVGQIGVNMSFLLDNLYTSFRFGKFSMNETMTGDSTISYDSSLFGILLNYQLVLEKSVLARSLLWRGFSIESGIITVKNTTNYIQELDTFDVLGTLYRAKINPSIDIEINNKAYLVPVELYTSFRFLYILNFGVGGGFDYVAGGYTDLRIHSSSSASASAFLISPDAGPTVEGEGEIVLKADTLNQKADKFRPKIMANAGFGIGPVYIDVPATIYADNGYSIGITAGIVW